MDDKKKSNNNILYALVAVFVLLAVGMLIVNSKPRAPSAGQPAAETTAATTENPPQPQPATPTTTTEAAPATAPVAESTPAGAQIDVASALSERILGDVKAPLKVSEHVSLTCSHCGEFYKNTFDEFKKNYIDTGKAYLVFSDFPLNLPALQAAMVARCLPHEKYFDFIHMLFAKQEEWAYDPNYISYLKARAAENGLSEAQFQACVDNTELREGIENRMKSTSVQWNINSTPSFVLNNKSTISGAYPYADFAKVLDEEAAKAKDGKDIPAAAPAATTPPSSDSEGAGKAEKPSETPKE